MTSVFCWQTPRKNRPSTLATFGGGGTIDDCSTAQISPTRSTIRPIDSAWERTISVCVSAVVSSGARSQNLTQIDHAGHFAPQVDYTADLWRCVRHAGDLNVANDFLNRRDVERQAHVGDIKSRQLQWLASRSLSR